MREYKFINQDKGIDIIIDAMSLKKATRSFEGKHGDLKEVRVTYINKKNTPVDTLIKLPLRKRKNKY